MEMIKNFKRSFNESSAFGDAIADIGAPIVFALAFLTVVAGAGIEIHKTYFNDQIQETPISAPSLKMDH